MPPEVIEAPPAPPAGPSPEELNNQRRAAMERKSQELLKAAVAEVSADKTRGVRKPLQRAASEAPQAAPQPSAPAARTDEPPPSESAPPESAAAAEPTEPEPPAKVESVSKSLEAKARRTLALRRDAQKAALAEQRAAELEKRLAQAEQMGQQAFQKLQLLQKDPRRALQEAGHDPKKFVTDWLSQPAEVELTAEQKAIQDLQSKAQAYEEWAKQQQLVQERQAMASQVAQYQSACAEAIADKDAFEYVHLEGGTSALYRYIVDAYELGVEEHKAGKITDMQLRQLANLSPKVYAKKMEAELEERITRAKAAKKFGGTAAAATGSQAASSDGDSNMRAARDVRPARNSRLKVKAEPEEEGPRTLSSRATGVRTVPFKQKMSEKDLVQAAIKAFEQSQGRGSRRQ